MLEMGRFDSKGTHRSKWRRSQPRFSSRFQYTGGGEPVSSMKFKNSFCVTSDRAMRNAGTLMACAHFSLSKMKPSAAVDPIVYSPPGIETSPPAVMSTGGASVRFNDGGTG